jgi:hypothetical protein
MAMPHRPGPRPAAGLLAGALLLSACPTCVEEILNPVPPPSVQTDEFCQRPASKVDVLWVVDNSGSMTAEQNRIADRFRDFFRQLNVSLVDYHIGVVTTAMAPGMQEEANGVLRRYSGPAVQGCDGCRWLTKEVPCPNPDVTRGDGESVADYEARLRTECPASLVFRRLVTVGNQGSSFERGLGASTLALGALIDPETGNYVTKNGGPAVPDANQGFLRRRSGTCQPEARGVGLDCSRDVADNCAEPSLYVIYVSDEEDKSDGPSRYYFRVLENLKGPGNEAKVSTSVITGWPVNAVVPLDRACDVLRNSYDDDPGNDQDLAAVRDILSSTGIACRDTSDPDQSTNSSVVGGRYVDVACRTGGVVADICSGDYSSALNNLGADAAGLARKYALSKWSEMDWGDDSTPLTGDDPKLDCDGDPAHRGPEDRALCVKATPLGGDAEQLVPMNAATGWRLERSTRSIRFDGSFIPKPGTKVTVTYQLRAQG